MPFLRFTRDKRGYETTSLVHAQSGRQGRVRQKVLYWFRSPPNVKVGRPALDQEAIRWIEEHNPDIEFDWPQILQSTAPPAPPAEDARGRRPRRGRTEKPVRSERSEPRGAQRAAAAPPRPPVIPAPADPVDPADPADDVAPPNRETVSDPGFSALSPEPPKNQDQNLSEPPEPLELEEEALEQITHPDTDEAPQLAPSAVESVLGREQLIRFRARYAELQARIIERGGEPARVEELRAQAEPLNPDSWVTVDEARRGLQEFEPKIRELRAAIGLKRRRRSRRGGRRRRGPQSLQPGQPAGDTSPAQTDTGESASNSEGAQGGGEDGDEG